MKNNNIPEFLLCPTPELARQVLEKIESESDLRWHAGDKPSYFTPDEYYPEMVIETASDRLFYSKKKYKIDDGITNFTKAEDYLTN